MDRRPRSLIVGGGYGGMPRPYRHASAGSVASLGLYRGAGMTARASRENARKHGRPGPRVPPG